jgi:hypothetical protein
MSFESWNFMLNVFVHTFDTAAGIYTIAPLISFFIRVKGVGAYFIAKQFLDLELAGEKWVTSLAVLVFLATSTIVIGTYAPSIWLLQILNTFDLGKERRVGHLAVCLLRAGLSLALPLNLLGVFCVGTNRQTIIQW